MSDAAPEEWAPVAWPPGYEASTDGRVRNARTGRILSCRSNGAKGYRSIELGRRPSRGGTGRRAYVHELVLEAFYGPRPVDPDDAYEGHHRDFDRANNRLDNLEWMPASQNQLIRRRNTDPANLPEWLGHVEPDTDAAS